MESKGRILIVEDEALIALTLQECLENEGYECAVVDTVETAVRLAQSEKLDAAVIDINLRGELAYPALRALRNAKVPCVFASGYARRNVPKEFAHIPHLEKPYQVTDVVSAIEVCLKARTEHTA